MTLASISIGFGHQWCGGVQKPDTSTDVNNSTSKTERYGANRACTLFMRNTLFADVYIYITSKHTHDDVDDDDDDDGKMRDTATLIK